MRLSKLRLAGFKSFVEPTVLSFPSNRVGVVGPNGCGKSNIIDAVRWVMGEISAKNLRGGAMTDVIFNGSTARSPVDTALIELVFEEVNLSQYPEHSEIAVKREISREGQSTYFLNGVKCRRKDITDLFLGTGLGPRSYAIIEQGMISRFIEAKPEDLRIFLEEAAGISKYKERRKDTEQSMKQTRENLGRLEEIRNELARQLEKLQKQAKEAERYQKLKEEEHLLKAQLLALRWSILNSAVQQQQQLIDENSLILQQDLLALQTLETTYQQQREDQVTAQAHLTEVQERFYELENEIQRLEQVIEHTTERKEQLQTDLAHLEETIAEARQQLETDQQQVTEWVATIQSLELELTTVQTTEQETEQTLQEAEFRFQDWQENWELFNQQATAPAQQAQVERTRLENVEQRLQHNQQRLLRLEETQKGLRIDGLEQAVTHLSEQMVTVKTALESAEDLLNTHQEAVLTLRDTTQQWSAELYEKRAQVNQLSGRLASLETLQESALGKNNTDLEKWLHHQGLREVSRLGQFLTVEPGWELAVEKVLGEILQALCLDDKTDLLTLLPHLPQNKLILFETHQPMTMPPVTVTPLDGISLLINKVKSPWSLASFLSSIWAAETLPLAYQWRNQLLAHESVITPQGLWLGINWVRSPYGNDVSAGTIAREQDIRQVAAQLNRLDKSVITLSGELEQQRLALRQHEESRVQAQQQVDTLRQQWADLHSQQSGQKARLEHLKTQIEQLTTEQAELSEQIVQDQQIIISTRKSLHQALATVEQLATEREQLARQRDFHQEQVIQLRHARQIYQDQRHQLEVRLESLRTDESRLQQSIRRITHRLEQLNSQRFELQDSLAQQSNPVDDFNSDLADYQQQRDMTEEILSQAKQALTQLMTTLNDCENQRRTLETRTQELRTTLEQIRMEYQTHQVRQQTVEEQLTAMELSLQPLLANLPEYAEESQWQTQIEAIGRKLQRIGSVNLAALEEYAEQAERKQYLDRQVDDLNKSLDLLSEAIRTIDREIRSRFKQTVETINTSLQHMFPRLFGGGYARLELTNDDVLTAGVTIIARPPGKRNTTIHLLSGGEKALTAIALVFAIFELNPAPFCMLDEVDAPLDDTNVGRFCALVKAMSERVQFIFISHNKITMEIADQLIGITMQEAGVSRPVTVDINMAMNMIAA
ncbi:MAG: chromosome segregation protein SMC [Beggiatoa sp. IS2]|nr:MAG: chromosome segregation protein SMC [Beggiatoa sp. IS2]